MPDSTLPLITAVIPTRRRAGLVLRAVRSALGQTYPNVEVVVVVDGPDAETVETLQGLAESRLRVIALAENVGGSKARNIGVREAQGRWIALLDDDDQWMPEKLAKQMATMAHTDARHCLVTCRRLERQPGQPDILAPRRLPRTASAGSTIHAVSPFKPLPASRLASQTASSHPWTSAVSPCWMATSCARKARVRGPTSPEPTRCSSPL